MPLHVQQEEKVVEEVRESLDPGNRKDQRGVGSNKELIAQYYILAHTHTRSIGAATTSIQTEGTRETLRFSPSLSYSFTPLYTLSTY